MTFTTKFTNQIDATHEAVVIGLWQDEKPSNSEIQSYLDHNKEFKGKAGQTLIIPANSTEQKKQIILGLGEQDDSSPLSFETIGGKLCESLKDNKTSDIAIELTSVLDSDLQAHLVYGFLLKSYSFTKYQAKAKKSALKTVSVITKEQDKAEKTFETLSAISQGVFLARDLVNEPPNILQPESYAEKIKEELKPIGVDVEVIDQKKLEKLGFEALLNVGKGSVIDSQVVVMKWNGNKKQKKSAAAPIAFVGKGVTFDTGGISLKPGAEMDLMKMDMGGSATVVGTMKALAARKANINAIGIVGLVENMPAGNAYRPGDIIGSLSGKTIEVLNTDAEGRLVLADILTYVQQQYKPSVIIDLATLTGAMMVALGFEYSGVFTNNNDLWSKLESASDNTGEKLWRMPLDKAYRKEVESNVADLKNLGASSYGGACTAAAFLEHFIEEGTTWAHFDIAGTAWWKTAKPTVPKGGTGVGVRALNNLLINHFEEK